ncbi:MAG: AAA family ATPase, partial [Gemmatimonadetes bacterium]|nr:AAA family ATPase [Gemmatimonadota bacterium]
MSVFVGRARELEFLGRALDRAVAGQGGVVLVKGEAGAGKSSLIQQFLLEATTRLPALRVLVGECSEQYGAAEPYQPFVEAFRALVHAAEHDAPAGKRRLRDLAKQVAPYWLQVIPVAGDLIAAAAQTATELRRTWGGGGTTAAPSEETLFFQYTELVLAVAAEQPILLFIDDLHWADPASVSLLAHLGRKIADQRVLILGTYRETDVAVAAHPLQKAKLELERYRVATEIALAPLDASELAAFVREELGAPAEPELLRWLSERAGSTPLFFGELLRWLVGQGLVQERGGRWALVRVPEGIEIPRTAEAIIEKRLTRLAPELYRIVEYASVFGAEFDSVSLAKLLGMDELELEEALEVLARKHQLIRLEDTQELPTGDFASIYEFSHSLVQHAVHKTVQGKRRILLHRKVAEILEATYGADTRGVAGRLAFHCDEG